MSEFVTSADMILLFPYEKNSQQLLWELGQCNLREKYKLCFLGPTSHFVRSWEQGSIDDETTFIMIFLVYSIYSLVACSL